MTLAERLNKRVTLQTRTTGKDDYGQPIETYQNVVTDGDGALWAEVKDVSGKLFIGADQVERSVTTEITIRARDDLPTSLYVLYKGDRYEVQGEPLGQDGRTMKLVCVKVSP